MFKNTKKLGKAAKESRAIQENSALTEQIRMIHFNLQHTLLEDGGCLMVTSTEREKHLSVISSQLAEAFAEEGFKVLLADVNVSHPTLHTYYNIECNSGLVNALLYGDCVLQHITETEIMNLSILPAGWISNKPAGLWKASHVKRVVESCKEEFDIVIYNAPPLLNTADSQILLKYCDGVIAVAAANATKKDHLIQLKEVVFRADNRLNGVILKTR
ncbi:tyrosine protein kinase [Halobacillus andaensis]|uniref:Tyrosine protein kinase n=1 Tax=Halobacillus andaensis TaxID=1176239 RepID=A0A917EWN1_HALAA|nr:CpsD/CapB family tyrosine-protein kinase [Halobacillus andaensis]MBP2005807.1 capsular exopolysaccharide synthesis family protein [Halobacillus andaensis]GGF25909.1 tyrosine protein kinase [Halobacillus andaensis]